MRALFKSLLGAKSRSVLKLLWIHCLSCTGMLSLAQRRVARNGGIVVLTFHRVLPESRYRSTYSPSGMFVKKETFEALARYVSQHYTGISLSGQQPHWTPDASRPRLALTFDDGWSDNFDVAGPIARKYSIPLAIFVCPAKVGLQMPYWPERVNALLCRLRSSESAIRKVDNLLQEWARKQVSTLPSISSREVLEPLVELLKVQTTLEREDLLNRITAIADTVAVTKSESPDSTMAWEEIRSLQATGVVFGSHSNSHEILPRIPLPEAEREVADAKRDLEERLGSPCSLFSYPNGDWSRSVRDLVSQAGYRFAFINKPGIWTSASDPLLIPRTNIWEGNLVGLSGRFSPIAFQYAAFWLAYRSQPLPDPREALPKLSQKAASSEDKSGVRVHP